MPKRKDPIYSVSESVEKFAQKEHNLKMQIMQREHQLRKLANYDAQSTVPGQEICATSINLLPITTPTELLPSSTALSTMTSTSFNDTITTSGNSLIYADAMNTILDNTTDRFES